jgi:hypothetical protein
MKKSKPSKSKEMKMIAPKRGDDMKGRGKRMKAEVKRRGRSGA